MLSFDLISSAHAQAAAGGAAAGSSGGLMGILPLVLMFGVLFLLVIRPQMKRQKEHKALIEGIQKGDEVIVNGGLVGKITNSGDTFLTLEVATLADKPVEVLVQRVAVQTVLPRGTIKDSR